MLSLSKLADIPIRLHRAIPEDAKIKQATLKKELTGERFATFGVELDREPPEAPENPEKCVGIDVWILKYPHDTDDTAVGSLDLSAERDCLEREQRKLSRKHHGSNNYETQRQQVVKCHTVLRQKRRDFLHKLSNYYAREYDLVAVEDLNMKGMIESPSNSRNTASSAWRTFLSLLEYNCEREGTHFVVVNPKGTSKECASCEVSTAKSLLVREHTCPSCGFEADRDANAVVRPRLTGSKREAFATAWNILSRGLEDVGVGYSKSTPVETTPPVDTPVSAERVHQTLSGGLSDVV